MSGDAHALPCLHAGFVRLREPHDRLRVGEGGLVTAQVSERGASAALPTPSSPDPCPCGQPSYVAAGMEVPAGRGWQVRVAHLF